jgi:uncharacterized protein (DUF1810 family)
MVDLHRFKEAQDQPGSGFAAALEELQCGRKQGHWIWWVFPQLAGLGTSWNSTYYGIDGRAEAAAYLREPILRDRFLAATRAIAEQVTRGVALERLMASRTDALKVVSSLTLFHHIAGELRASEDAEAYRDISSVAQQVLASAEREGYSACAYTLQHLHQAP